NLLDDDNAAEGRRARVGTVRAKPMAVGRDEVQRSTQASLPFVLMDGSNARNPARSDRLDPRVPLVHKCGRGSTAAWRSDTMREDGVEAAGGSEAHRATIRRCLRLPIEEKPREVSMLRTQRRVARRAAIAGDGGQQFGTKPDVPRSSARPGTGTCSGTPCMYS